MTPTPSVFKPVVVVPAANGAPINFLERGNTGSDVRCVNFDGARGLARTGSDTRKRDEEVLAAGIEGDLRWGTARRSG
jgi:hypothetical protein